MRGSQKRKGDRVQRALDLLTEYATFMACGIYVPERLVRQAKRDLRLAASHARNDAMHRRERRQRQVVQDG